MTGHHVPTWILQDPPKHLDWFYDPQRKHGSWLNVDRTDSLNLTVTDATTSTYSSQTDTTTSWTIGASATLNVTASTDVGLKGQADAGLGLSVSASVGGSYDHNHDWYGQSGSSNTLSVSGATNDDDLMAGTERTWSVYRYPIVNYTLKDTNGDPLPAPGGQPQYGFYEITIPGATVPFGPGGGRAFGDWYQPPHQNGNALSYPALDAQTGLVPLDPGVLGPPVTLAGSDGGGTPVTLPQPLLNKGYLVDPTGSSVELSIAQTSGSGDTTNATGTLSESLDVDGGMSAKFACGVGSESDCADLDIKVNNSNSWGSLKTSSNSTTSTNTFTLQQDAAAQPNWAYGAATAYYTDPAGVYRAAHAVNLLASSEAAPEWRQYYGGRPDPALNLPGRMVMTYSKVDKANDIPNWNTSASRQQIRGFFVLNPDAAHGGPERLAHRRRARLQPGGRGHAAAPGARPQLQPGHHGHGRPGGVLGRRPGRRRREQRGVAGQAGHGQPGHHPRPGLGAGQLPVGHQREGPGRGQALPHLRHRRPERPRQGRRRPLERRHPRLGRPLRRPRHGGRHALRRPPDRPLHRRAGDARGRPEQARVGGGDPLPQAPGPRPADRRRPIPDGRPAGVRQRRRPRRPPRAPAPPPRLSPPAPPPAASRMCASIWPPPPPSWATRTATTTTTAPPSGSTTAPPSRAGAWWG